MINISDNPLSFKDNFSTQSATYATHRPQYPDSLFRYLSGECRKRQLSWDAGTGNGQAALKLAQFFEKVYATDASCTQIKNAVSHPKINYVVGQEKAAKLESNSVDLITVAQALHWFDLDTFYSEASRVLNRFGIIACWTYPLFSIEPTIDEQINWFYSEFLGNYWDAERRFVETGYRSLPFPFREMKAPRFEMKAKWTFDNMIGFLRSWSSVSHYIKQVGRDPILENEERFLKAWGDRNETKTVIWPINMRIGRSRELY